jgi:enediyne biosynthesis protein E4
MYEDVTKAAGLAFVNQLVMTDTINPYTYRNFYNGAGVAVGDINNDGFNDIYFTGNQVENKLFVNKGSFKFEDITAQAGVSCPGVWSTGVTMADVNGDGWLDIYVCKSGPPGGANRNNELFINNHNLTFTEMSHEWGLDIEGLSVQATFFDYDKDGDLDCYLLTNSVKSVGGFDMVKDQRKIPDPQGGGNKLLVNTGNKFVDYSIRSGIYTSNIGFGLGVTLGDFNSDSWIDIFVSNDFFERDYLYINKQNGKFEESLPEYFSSISMGSMGAEYADLDNDGASDLFVTEMLPDSLSRRKTKTVFDSWNKYQWSVENGYFHQFSRNVLQRNIGNNRFVEIGRLAGVSSTEWSWGALLFDMDNDGLRDIFVANGIRKDLLDRDYLTYQGSKDNIQSLIQTEDQAILKLINQMPSSQFPNYAFKNLGHFQFVNTSQTWGLAAPQFSTGCAYADFDNDGDLDLVLNNIDSPAVIYKNNTDTSQFKSISIELSSSGKNTHAVGAHIKVYKRGKIYVADNFNSRGFQSSSQHRIHIGLGSDKLPIDSIHIFWPEGGYTPIYEADKNSVLKISKELVSVLDFKTRTSTAIRPFQWERINVRAPAHKASRLNEFNRERLLPYMQGIQGPYLSSGNIDEDSLPEVYCTGGKDQSSFILKWVNSEWVADSSLLFVKNKQIEEMQSILVDVDNDHDLDVYVASGGRFYPRSSSLLLDKIFTNNGVGEFSERKGSIPLDEFLATSCVQYLDYDQDKDMDIVIGEIGDPFVYATGGGIRLLENISDGNYKDVTRIRSIDLISVGLVTDMVVCDFDNDGWNDLVLVGDWMAIQFFRNNKGYFQNVTSNLGLNQMIGWWNSIESDDLNGDGIPDFVVGNHGLNTFFEEGDRAYINDFDKNGSIEQIYCTKVGNRYYPVVDRDDLLAQLPSLKKMLLYNKEYSKMSIEDIFSPKTLEGTKILQVSSLKSIMLVSSPSGYQVQELPSEAQYSPLYALKIVDMDNDGILDLLAGGNNYYVKPQFGRFDASFGWFFKGNLRNNDFYFQPGVSLGVDGQIRDIEVVDCKNFKYIFFSKYGEKVESFKLFF